MRRESLLCKARKAETGRQKVWSCGTEHNTGSDGLARRCPSLDLLSSSANMKLKTVCVVFLVFLLRTSYCESDLEESRADPR